MGILEQLEVYQTPDKKPNPFVKATLDVKQTETRDFTLEFVPQSKYRVSLHLESHYWATDVEAKHAEKRAVRSLINHLYGFALAHVDVIAHAVMNNDKDVAIEFCDKLRREFTEI